MYSLLALDAVFVFNSLSFVFCGYFGKQYTSGDLKSYTGLGGFNVWYMKLSSLSQTMMEKGLTAML